MYATPEAPPDYTLELEVAGVQRAADERGWRRFHVVGYSGGGATALAVAARWHPQPVRLRPEHVFASASCSIRRRG